MEKVGAVIFDSDGTLFSAGSLCKDTLKQTCRKFGLKFDNDAYAKTKGSSRSDRIKVLFPNEYDKIWSFWNELYSLHYCAKVKVFPGVIPELKRLKKKGILLFIFSTKDSYLVKQALEKYKIVDLFTNVVGGELSPKKPNKKRLVELSKKYEFELSNSVLVGDTKIDFEAAKNAGIPFILIEYEKGKAKGICYDEKISSLIQLKEVIKK